MKKADVETVKNFASKTTDRARPAYGHFLVKQKRHSIDFDIYGGGHLVDVKTIKIIHGYADTNTTTRECVASSDILTYILKIPTGQQEKRHTMKLADVMRHLGWERPPNGNVTIDHKQV